MDNTQQSDHTISLDQSQADGALWNVEKVVLDTLDFKVVAQQTCNALLTQLNYLQLGYRIIVLAIADKEKQILQRVSISQTTEAQKALEASPIPFKDLDIPFSAVNNISIKAYNDKKPYNTRYWPDILTPPMTDDQAVQTQMAIGIKSSIVYPVVARNECLGIIIFSLIKDISEVTEKELDLLAHFTDVVGIAVQNAKLFSSLEQTTEYLKQANVQIGLAGKLKADLLTMASHEFRTPLANMKNMLWALGKPDVQINCSEKSKQYFDHLKSSVDRLDYVVNNINQMLLATSGNLDQDLHFTSVQVERIIREVLDDKEVEFRDALIKLNYQDPVTVLPSIEADTIKFKYVIYELITNALKYTDKNGTINITTEVQDQDIVIKIADTGRGIPAEILPNIFQGFTKPDPMHTTQSGMGLGLFLVGKIIQLHSGRIKVESEVGKGTTFTITLPIMKQ